MTDHSNVASLSDVYTQPQCVSLLSQIADSVTCIVCQELMAMPLVLECGHSYCYDCISTWFTKVNTCPSCRKVCRKIPHISHAAAGIAKSLISALIETDPSKKEEYEALLKRQTEEYNQDLEIHNRMFPGLFLESEEGSDIEYDVSLSTDLHTMQRRLDSDTPLTFSDSDSEGSSRLYGVPGDMDFSGDDSPVIDDLPRDPLHRLFDPGNVSRAVCWLDRSGQKHYLDWGTPIDYLIMRSYHNHRQDISVFMANDAAEPIEEYHDASDSNSDPSVLVEQFHDASPSGRRSGPGWVMIEAPPRGSSAVRHCPPSTEPDISLGHIHAISSIWVEPTMLTIVLTNGDSVTFVRGPEEFRELENNRYSNGDSDIGDDSDLGSDSEGYFSS